MGNDVTKENLSLAVHLHIYYLDMWPELKKYLANIGNYPYDLYVTLTTSAPDIEKEIKQFKSDAKIWVVENRGYDVGPFVDFLHHIDLNKYDLILKLHSKHKDQIIDMPKSDLLSINAPWGESLFSGLLGSNKQFQQNIKQFTEDNKLGMCASNACIITKDWSANVQDGVDALLKEWGFNRGCFKFIMGTIFMCRAKLLAPIKEHLTINDFELTDGKVKDGTLAHIIERVLGCLSIAQGYKIEGFDKTPWHYYRLNWKYLLHFIYSNKITKKNCRIIKVLTIPVYHKQLPQIKQHDASAVQMISVVRNFGMYERLVKNNLFNKGMEFVYFDNNQENLGISARYNSFLDNYDYSKEAWFVFCHEDWEAKENLAERLKGLNKNCLYGPIGAPFAKNILWNSSAQGKIEESQKDGSELKTAGQYNNNLPVVGTFDCQCLIVHSSLVKKYHLRFDENLYFDLYVEDFCINARENYGVSSRVLQLKCRHWSKGKVSERFNEKLIYLKEKYKNAKYFYITPVNTTKITSGISLNTFGFYNLIVKSFKFLCKFIFQAKKTKKNKLLVKIFRIPVFSKEFSPRMEIKEHPIVSCQNKLSILSYLYQKEKLDFLQITKQLSKKEIKKQKGLLRQKKRLSKSKLGIAYNVFDGEELLEASIKSVREVASYIVIVYQTVSNFKEVANPDLVPLLNRLKEQGLVDDLYSYEPRFDEIDNHYNEKRKRDIGLELVKRAGCDYFLSMDTDEFYHAEQIKNAMDFILDEKIECSAVNIVEYIKEPTNQLVNGYTFAPTENKQEYNFYVPFIMKVHRFKEQGHSGVHFPCFVDPTRGLNNRERFYLFPKHVVAMHHMCTIRQDLARKYANSNLRKGDNDKSLSELQSQILSFDFNKNLVEVSNFNGVYVQKVPNTFDIEINEKEVTNA